MSYSNYDEVLEQLRADGLIVDTLVTGKLQRCRVEGDREKRGWYLLHELRVDSGDLLLVGSFGVWHGNDQGAKKIELRKRTISAEQRDALRKRLAEDKRAAERERAASAERAAERARKAWAALSADTVDDHPYLVRKGVRGHGLKVGPSGGLAIPMVDGGGRIHGLQIIRAPSARQRHLDKEFWPAGIAKKGRFHLIGRPVDIVLIAEGYATAASLHEATQLPVAVAFDAGNLAPVGAVLRDRYPRALQLYCADDDTFASCLACKGKVVLLESPTDCPHCGAPHQRQNTGLNAASAAALAHKGAWVSPNWSDESLARRRADFTAKGAKLSDFNDLHALETLNAVRVQIETKLTALGWRIGQSATRANNAPGAGGALRPIEFLDELVERFALVFGHGGTVFDHQEHQLVALSDMRDACMRREISRAWQEHPDRKIVRIDNVGFDPGGEHEEITCNLWGGWPTTPKPGKCERLLELLWYMTGKENEPVRTELYHWLLRWLAYPIQHAGGKLDTTVVIHGPQGTGKNTFFECVAKIYGRYGQVIDQAAVEDKFNDCFSRLLFFIADEVVARSELYHVKNKLKGLISNDRIRINPKNMAAWWEDNHCNGVFLSNESIPVVLEENDRRYAVIYTPEKLPQEFYAAVYAEIEAGGVAALHDYLLKIDLGNFGKGTKPPWTDAKAELIDQSLDSTSRFFYAWQLGDLDGVPFAPALSEQAFEAYRLWCNRINVRAAPMPRLVNTLSRKHGLESRRMRYMAAGGVKGPHGVLIPAAAAPPEGTSEGVWLGGCIDAFAKALKGYRGDRKGVGDDY